MDEAQVYTLRVWHAGQRFRAALRAVGEEHSEVFTTPAQLADFLARAPRVAPAEPVSPPPAAA